jgi:phosphoribosyl-AMP cyclohydrolase
MVTLDFELDFELDFKKGKGLIPAIAQDCNTGEVLMLAYMNQASFNETLASGKATYFSRSRQSLWKKGETSGHVQQVKEIRVDCDRDTILLKVEQVGGAACHKGYKSCFFKRIENNELKIVEKKVFDPDMVYK